MISSPKYIHRSACSNKNYSVVLLLSQMRSHLQHNGFTLIELIIVIVILGILSVIAAPKFMDLGSDARAASLNGIAGQMRSTISLATAKARINGLRAVSSNPSGIQAGYIVDVDVDVDFGFGSAEVDFRNLCPESEAELGTQLNFINLLNLSLTDDMSSDQGNRYTIIRYEPLPTNNLNSTTISPLPAGCYVIYDSFGDPDCTVVVMQDDC